ncbi:glycosyltransferase [Formosa sp. L2A11]|uniref:glycosyltransferase n=1 Tax=Formosa sp. L2A11 TaxID=2686363 RepID=UPI00131AB62E|nr:glycosyltransferase [Formosa sp. L2A11]
MKLAIVTAYPPSKIALNQYAYHLVKHFRQKKDITEIVLLTDKTRGEKDLEFIENGCKVTVKKCWSFNSFSNLFSVTRAITNTKPDAILFNLSFKKFGNNKIAAAFGLMLPLICKYKKIPNIVLLHNIFEEVDLERSGYASNKLMKKFYGFIGTTLTGLVLHADTVVVTEQKHLEILELKYLATHIKFIPQGSFELPLEPNYILPTEGPMKIMAFGQFGTYKKVEGLIEAVELVRDKTGLDLEIVIAGTDNPNVPGYLAKVKEKYKHVPQLRFTGFIIGNEMSDLFKESAVVVFPYTSPKGSLGILHEAGNHGKAVIMPGLGDLAHFVKDGGYKAEFFNPKSITSLANAIDNIVTNNAHRIRLGQANYKAATAFPMSKITDIYLETFNTIIEEKPKFQNYQINKSVVL